MLHRAKAASAALAMTAASEFGETSYRDFFDHAIEAFSEQPRRPLFSGQPRAGKRFTAIPLLQIWLPNLPILARNFTSMRIGAMNSVL